MANFIYYFNGQTFTSQNENVISSNIKPQKELTIIWKTGDISMENQDKNYKHSIIIL